MIRLTPGRLAAGTLALVAVLAASSASPAVRPAQRQIPAAAPASRLMAFGSRSAAQQRSLSGGKLDGALADLARHATLARPGSLLADLRSLSPAAHFMQPGGGEPLVLIDAVTRGDPQQLKAALVTLGLQHPSVYSNDVSGWLPVRSIDAAGARAEVISMRAALSRTRAGAVTSQGDFAQGSATLRAGWAGLDGSGVTVGVLSDSFNCYAVYEQPGSGVPRGAAGYAPAGFTADAQKDTSTGDLPASVNVLEEAGQLSSQGTCLDYGPPQFPPYADEGRALLQIVHDVAPGATLAFHTASEGEADFANGITALAAAGARVIADDVGYYDEPFFQDGLIAQAVDSVAAKGVAYFSAAGNNGRQSYDNLAPKFTDQGSGPNAGEQLLNFDTSGATSATSLSVTIPALQPGEFIAIVVEWDQPFVTGAAGSPGASSSIDLCVSGASGFTVINLDGTAVTCTGPNATGADPVQVLIIGVPANASAAVNGNTTLQFRIGLANGTSAPGRIKLVVEDDCACSTINKFATNSPTLQGHPGATGAAAVAAAFFADTPLCGTSPPKLESYSSAGGDPILFDTSGNAITPVVRQKPQFVGPDGVNTTFFLYPLADYGVTDSSSVAQCANDTSFPSFFGTSAATPHAAAAAALMLQAQPALTAAQITAALENTAQAIAATPPDYDSGYGFISVDAALASLPVAALSITSSALPSGQVGQTYAAAVTATGGFAPYHWALTSGTLPTGLSLNAASGAIAGTPTASAAGSALTFRVTDSGPSAQSKSATLSLTIAAPSSSGGGGGAMEAVTLLALSGLAFMRLRSVGQRRGRISL